MMASFVPAQPHQQMLPMPNSYMQHHAMYTLGQPHPQHFMANQGMHGMQQQHTAQQPPVDTSAKHNKYCHFCQHVKV